MHIELSDQRISNILERSDAQQSESTEGNDRNVKYDDYEAHEVQEYWIVDPEKRQSSSTFWTKKASTN